MYDVLIVGAGIVGSFIARTLSRYNLDICLVEKDNDIAMGTTKANSAIVHAGYDCKPNSLKAKFNVEGNAMMDKVSQELDIPFKRIGSLVLAFGEEDNKTLESLMERAEQNGVDGCEIWDKQTVLQHEPNLSDNVTGALYSKTAGIICPYELNIGVAENAVINGVDLRLNCEVLDISKDEHFTVKTNQGELKSKFVINAAGVYSDIIANMVGDESFFIKPRKGEYLLFDKKFSDTVGKVIFQCPSKMGKGILVTPTVDGNMIMGPTALDIEDRDDRSTSDEGIEKVKQGGQKSLKSVDFSGVIHSFSGIRATGSTGDFVIEPSKVCENFINVGAIESPGLSSAPAISEYVKDMLENKGLKLEEKDDYNPNRKRVVRFRELDNEAREKLIKENPKYGHIICRCEMVTEGEILDAIHRPAGATDLDGVKRRTRSGMGRCQGGFCKPKVVEILSRELGIPMTEVTKKGAESFVLASKIKE